MSPSPQSIRRSGQDHVIDIIREKICHFAVAVVYEERRIGLRLPEVERCHMDDETLEPRLCRLETVALGSTCLEE